MEVVEVKKENFVYRHAELILCLLNSKLNYICEIYDYILLKV